MTDKLSDGEILAQVWHELAGTTGADSTLLEDAAYLYERYLGCLYGDEEEGRSQVISPDVSQVVDTDLTSLMRVFLGSNATVKFTPTRPGEFYREEAEQKTTYVDWQVRGQDFSYRVLQSWILDTLIFPMGIVHYGIDEKEWVDEQVYRDLSPDEIAIVFDQLSQRSDVKNVTLIDSGDGDNQLTFKLDRSSKNVCIENVNLEDFFLSKDAINKDDATLAGRRRLLRRGDLLSMGYDRELIDKLTESTSAVYAAGGRLKNLRDRVSGDDTSTTFLNGDISSSLDWALQEVEVLELYMLIDMDGSGIPTRRRLLVSGQFLLENEPFNHVPFAIMNSNFRPGTLVGRSRAAVAEPVARVKTSLLRAMQDNSYQVSKPRTVVDEDSANLDDVLNHRHGGVIRKKGSAPGAIEHLVTPYVGDRMLQVLQTWDLSLAQSTGLMTDSQGLSADRLQPETATRFEGVEAYRTAKVELVARNMVEGFKQLYLGVAWLNLHYQDSAQEILVNGEELIIDPSRWLDDSQVVAETTFDVGNDEKLLPTYQAILQLQQQLQQVGMSDNSKIYATIRRIINGAGLPDVSEFFIDPSRPQQELLAENEQLKAQLIALQQQAGGFEELQKQLVQLEVEKVKVDREKKILELETKLSKQEQDHAIELEKLRLKRDELDTSTALKLTEMELQEGKELNQKVRSNAPN